jgi:hypothetical protein
MCTICKKLQVVPGSADDYDRLACYHYRDGHPGPAVATFALRPKPNALVNLPQTVGVIIYTMPTAGTELRNIATGDIFTGFDRKTRLALINKSIRRIARVIIEPRFRGLGLAARLVRETMPKLNVPIIEALAVMGVVNPFFEKAGMTAYTAPLPQRCAELTEALSLVGIEEKELIDPQTVEAKLDALSASQRQFMAKSFIELQINLFLQTYGKTHNLKPSLERTKFVLSKLTHRPVYYIWFNPNVPISPHSCFRKKAWGSYQ